MTGARTKAGQCGRNEPGHTGAEAQWCSDLGSEGEGGAGGDLMSEPGRNLGVPESGNHVFPALVLHGEAVLMLGSLIQLIPYCSRSLREKRTSPMTQPEKI